MIFPSFHINPLFNLYNSKKIINKRTNFINLSLYYLCNVQTIILKRNLFCMRILIYISNLQVVLFKKTEIFNDVIKNPEDRHFMY